MSVELGTTIFTLGNKKIRIISLKSDHKTEIKAYIDTGNNEISLDSINILSIIRVLFDCLDEIQKGNLIKILGNKA